MLRTITQINSIDASAHFYSPSIAFDLVFRIFLVESILASCNVGHWNSAVAEIWPKHITSCKLVQKRIL